MKQNTLDLVGLPPAFGLTVLIFVFILALAPWLSGKDFGIFKVPQFSEHGRKRLRLIGPILLCIGILLHSNIWPLEAGNNPQRINLDGSTVARLDGVETPDPEDETIIWGADTLLDEYVGSEVVAPAKPPRSAEWDVDLPAGKYRVTVVHASDGQRPLRLLIDGGVFLQEIASEKTDSLYSEDRKAFEYGVITLPKRSRLVRLEALGYPQAWPHLKEIFFDPVGDGK